MTRQPLTTWIAAAAGILAAGCATAPAPEMGTPGEPSTVVEVTNHHPQLVVVEATSSGFDQRLGQVETNDTETFELPSNLEVSDLRIRIEPVGSTETYLSPRVSVATNDVVTVTVESNLALTTVAVR